MDDKSYLRFKDEISSLLRKTENMLDEELTTLYSFIARKSEYHAYELRMNIDPYDIKRILNYSFSHLNTDFLEELKYYINDVKRRLQEGPREEKIRNCRIFRDKVIDLIDYELPKQIDKGLNKFIDEFTEIYKANINEDAREIRRRLVNSLESEIDNLRGMIKRIVEDNIVDLTSDYMREQKKELEQEENEKKSQSTEIDLEEKYGKYADEIMRLEMNYLYSGKEIPQEFLKYINMYITITKGIINRGMDFENLSPKQAKAYKILLETIKYHEEKFLMTEERKPLGELPQDGVKEKKVEEQVVEEEKTNIISYQSPFEEEQEFGGMKL